MRSCAEWMMLKPEVDVLELPGFGPRRNKVEPAVLVDGWHYVQDGSECASNRVGREPDCDKQVINRIQPTCPQTIVLEQSRDIPPAEAAYRNSLTDLITQGLLCLLQGHRTTASRAKEAGEHRTVVPYLPTDEDPIRA